GGGGGGASRAGAASSLAALLQACSSSARRRSLRSPAAFSVKVTATIWSTRALPPASMAMIRRTSSLVLPVPAAASTIRLTSSWLHMAARASSSVIVVHAARAARRDAPAPSHSSNVLFHRDPDRG